MDLIPADYRRARALRRVLVATAVGVVAAAGCLGAARLGLSAAVERTGETLRTVELQRAEVEARRAALGLLEVEHDALAARLESLQRRRRGIAARDALLAVDAVLDGRVWFVDWRFERDQGGPDGSASMAIRGQAEDHAALADFVQRLVERPEVADVRLIGTRARRYTRGAVVEFEAAVGLPG